MSETKGVSRDEERLQYQLEELQQRASKDSVSGLLNRATVEQYIKKRLQKMTAEEQCALFIIDLDNFKQVNDTLGHQAGDQAIRQSARILSGLFRANDIVGRLGGDEFTVFLCGDITEEYVRKKAAQICDELHLALGDSQVVDITASVGVYLSARGQEFEGLYQAADLALYKAKKTGKHRYCLKDQDGYQEGQRGEFRPVSTIPLSGLLEYLDSGVALLEMGPRPQVIYVSPSYCRIIGAEPEDLPLPMAMEELIHPDDVAALEEALRTGLREDRAVEHTHRISAGGGKWAWWHIRATHVDYESPYPVMLITATDVSQYKESEHRLEETNRRLQAAFDQTAKRLWEVEMPGGTFRAFTRDGKYRELGDGRMVFPDALIDGGWIHPNSVSRFRAFARDLLDGHAQGYGNFAVRSVDTGYYSWATISYRALYDDAGRAVKAVGVLENLPPGFSGPDSWSPLQRPLPEGLVADLIVRMSANLELDCVESLWIEGSNLTSQVQRTRCSQILKMEREKIFGEADQETFLDFFDRERLLKAFEEGRRWLAAEYRRVDSDGRIRWVRHVLYLTEEPSSRQVYLFVYLVRMDPQHRLEQALAGEARRDEGSRLYDRATIQRMAETAFAGGGGGNRAVAVFQVNGLASQPQGALPAAGQMFYELATALSLALGGGCLLGQYSARELVVAFPSVTGKEELRRLLEEAVAFVRRVMQPAAAFDGLRFVTGVSVLPAAGASYAAMLEEALHACSFWWNAAADTVAFAQEAVDGCWEKVGSGTDEVAIHSGEMLRPLSESEKDVALDCVSGMLTARTLDASLMGVLQTIGTYYHADRVYTLMLVENGHALVMTFEWTNTSKRSIQQAVSGMRLDSFPLLRRCMDERAPIFVTRRHGPERGGEGEWYFTALPLIRGERVEGFLCIENAREHPGDAALFSTLIPHMLRQRERFRRADSPAGAAEQLMGLPDLRAYMEAVHTLDSEHFSSLGAVCLDIPNFAAINSSCGFEYGSRLLWYVAKTLADLFGYSYLYRTWDAEFIAFFPNTTREVFVGRCGRLRSIIQRRYPKEVRIGRAWAEGRFSGQTLVKEAKAAMHGEGLDTSDEVLGFAQRAEEYHSVGAAARAGRFTVYFQPKIDMRTGRLYGAEAMVRGIAEDGSIVAPGQFIEYLEQDGSIRDLDIYVLERSLDQADRWREEGLGLVPVATNISRATLVHPSTLASVLAVQSRYPHFPAEALELEVTERGGIETGEFRRIVERFRSCALRLSLDDFGSQYANLPLFTNVRFDTVKLDRSLITGLAGNPVSRMLVRDIVQICRAYGMDCVAEGVETAAQRDALLEAGCYYGQGYFYDPPLPAMEFELKYLRAHPARDANAKEEQK